MADVINRLNAALADRYRIEREPGAGSMATVCLAQDLKHDRKAAMKVLKPGLAAVLGADRFIQEIRTPASLQHAHILPLHDSGTADGFLRRFLMFRFKAAAGSPNGATTIVVENWLQEVKQLSRTP